MCPLMRESIRKKDQVHLVVHLIAHSSLPIWSDRLEGPCDVRMCFACIASLERFRALVGCQLARTSETHATILRSPPALAGPSPDQITLELRRGRFLTLRPRLPAGVPNPQGGPPGLELLEAPS